MKKCVLVSSAAMSSAGMTSLVTAMSTAGMSMLVIVMIALYVRIVSQFALQKRRNCIVCAAGNSSVKLNSCLCQSSPGSAADSSANKSSNFVFF